MEFKEGQLVELLSKEQELDGGLKELQAKISEHEALLKTQKAEEKKLSDVRIQIATRNTAIKGLNDTIARLEKEISSLQTTVEQVDQSELATIEQQIKQAQADMKQMLDDKAYYDVAATLLKDSGIKTNIVKQYLPVINKLVNKYLSSMDFFVNFNLDESFKESIKSRHGDEFSYHNFSEGEKQRIDMALMLTWRAIAKLKNSANTNLLVLDEVFDSSLDNTGTEELMKILHALDDANIFVISHKGDILQDKFANTIRFEKVKNFSRIVK